MEFHNARLAYERELEFYNAVKQGDLKKLKKLMVPLEDERLGILSKNPLRNLKYHLITTIALITRFCIEGGLPLNIAYSLSDSYIQQIDLATDKEMISFLHRDLIYDYASKMKDLRSTPGISQAIKRTIDYIVDNIQKRVTLDKISRAVGINRTYLCELFKKETGVSIQRYITKLKIEAAVNMLAYEDFSVLEISDYFSFSSSSHFCSVFKKETGLSPNAYRRANYRHHWK
ncbi:MAG: AraC family transcriptional regulator [Treponema sp.]|nr:AraC family transcriptional regulator [Treponema sp.]